MDHELKPIKVEKEFMEPNYEYIKRELLNVLSRVITERNLHKIDQNIAIKFTVDHRKFYFNSDISVLKSIKSLQPMINKMMEDFAAFIPADETSDKSGRAFIGKKKIDVKMNKSKQIYGSTYVEIPTCIKNKKSCVNIKNVLSC